MITIIKKIINYILQIRIDIICRRKLKKINKNIITPFINKALGKNYTKLWKKLGKKPSLLFLKCVNAISGIQSSKYVPENIYYGMIEPRLNNKAFALIFNDKNFFERYLPKYKSLFPCPILRGINGVIHDADFNRIDNTYTANLLEEFEDNECFILKPAIDTGGGSNVSLVIKVSNGFNVDNQLYSITEFIFLLKKRYLGNFILQKKIDQLQWFEYFNKSSLNTVRLYAYRSVQNEIIHTLHAYVRFGNPGSLVDSSSKGGFTCGISQSGVLNNFAVERYGRIRLDLEGIKKNGNSKVPFFYEMKKIAVEIAPHYHYHRLLGFDFCVDKNQNVRLLEINTRNIGVVNQQMNTGPLFGKFTEEIVVYCNSHKKSVVLDFYV